MVGTNPTTCFGSDKVGGVAVNAKDHIAYSVFNFSIWVAGGVIEKVSGGCKCGSSAIDSGGGDVIKCVQHDIVDSAGLKQKFTSDLLNEFDLILC